MKQIISSVSLTLCCIFLSLVVVHSLQRFIPKQWDSNNVRNTENINSSIPVRLRIPKIAIDLPIYKTSRTGNSWQISDKGVSYLQTSPLPGKVGTSVFYGHNWPNLLGKLSSLAKDSDIEIFLANGQKIIFTVSNLQVVPSSATLSLSINSSKKMILIYTCTGILDSQRFIAYGTLKEQWP